MGSTPPIIIYNDATLDSSPSSRARRVFLDAFETVHLAAKVGGVTGSPTSWTFNVKLQAKTPQEDSDWTDVTGGALTEITVADDTQFLTLTSASHLFGLDTRFLIEWAFVGGTSPTLTGVDLSWVGITKG